MLERWLGCNGAAEARVDSVCLRMHVVLGGEERLLTRPCCPFQPLPDLRFGNHLLALLASQFPYTSFSSSFANSKPPATTYLCVSFSTSCCLSLSRFLETCAYDPRDFWFSLQRSFAGET